MGSHVTVERNTSQEQIISIFWLLFSTSFSLLVALYVDPRWLLYTYTPENMNHTSKYIWLERTGLEGMKDKLTIF